MDDKDIIYRQEAIDALWKALFEYEDKTEKQFQESDELDISEWIAHRIFVQNMSDIDRQTIQNLPSAQPERKKGKWIGEPKDGIEAMFFIPKCSVCGFESAEVKNFCPNCGADMRGD